jgi:hypothetical protein
MISDYRSWDRTAELRDRLEERDTLDRLVDAVRAGESRVLVLSGEPGVGKTALLDYANSQAAGCRVAPRAVRPKRISIIPNGPWCYGLSLVIAELASGRIR